MLASDLRLGSVQCAGMYAGASRVFAKGGKYAGPVGYSSVAAMKSAAPFKVAHRGGSVLYPEMSEYAYRQSAPLVEALEFSCGRSSDGVWFGIHDRYLDRTSLGAATTTLDQSTMTWAQIQAYTINQKSRNDPYYRLDDFLWTYKDSHVLFIDPKAANDLGFLSELWTILDDAGVDKSRVVIKCTGDAQAVATGAAANGYESWGFLYQSYGDSALTTYGGYAWTMLGLDVSSDGTYTAAKWDLVKGLGKPTIGHICTNQAMVDGALAAGADGVMLADPTLSVGSSEVEPPAGVTWNAGAGNLTAYGYGGNLGLTDHVVSLPANKAVGDVLVAVIGNQSGAVGTLAVPSGWAVSQFTGANRLMAVAYCPIPDDTALSALGSTATFSYGPNTAQRMEIVVSRVTGADLSAPIVDAAQNPPAGGTTSAVTVPAYTAAAGVGAVVAVAQSNTSAGAAISAVTWDNSLAGADYYGQRPDTLAATGVHIGWKQVTGTSVPAVTATASPAASAALAVMSFAIKAAA